MADSYNFSSKAYRRKLAFHSTVRFIVCILLTIICLFPLFILFINATRSHNDILGQAISFLPGASFIDNWNALNSGFNAQMFDLFHGYVNSMIIAVASTVLTVFFSALTAYGLTVYDFKGKNFATKFILMVMMVPMQVVSVGFLQFMVQIKLNDNYLALILPSIAAPSVVFFMLQYMKSSFPLDIVEAARIDGSSEWRTFFSISLPIFKPAFAVQAIFAFVASWNNFYNPSMLLITSDLEAKTIPMMVQNILSNTLTIDFGAQYLAIALSILPIVIVYLCLSKFIIKGVALGAVKG